MTNTASVRYEIIFLCVFLKPMIFLMWDFIFFN